jgi:hypothetical protein
MEIIQKFEDRINAKLVKYIPEKIQENLLTSSSAAQEVSARTDILQAVQFYCQQLAKDSCKCRIGLTVKMTSYWKCITSESTKSFRASTIVFNFNRNEDCDDVTDEQIAAKHQKTSEDQGSNENDPTEHERVTNQGARKFIPGLLLYFMQQGNEGSPIPRLETCAEFAPLQSIMRTGQAALEHLLQRH